MGLFQKIFGKNQPSNTYTTKFEMISDVGDGFYSWDGNLYRSDIVRACIRPKAQAIGKLVAKHIRDNPGDFKVNPDANIRFLLEEPNPLMTGQMFQEKMTVQLALNHNAFAYIKKDELGNAYEIYPIPCTKVNVVQGKNGDVFLKFFFRSGKHMTVPYSDVIHLRKDFNDNDFFGDHPAPVLSDLMEVVGTIDQGLVKAIKNSSIIKWILKFKSVLKQDDMDTQVKNFINNYLSIDNVSGGAAASDPRYDLEQVKPESYVPNADQMDKTTQRIYGFFNTNEKIIQSKFTEDEWNAYYESEIEPLAMQLSGEFTRKIFSRRERGFGNKIIFEASNLIYASMKTKLGLSGLVDRGIMSRNEVRTRAFNLPPVEGGDELVMRLDMAPVKGGENDDDEQDGTA
ncbi:phage portal protein [Halalkalibacter krulwichiae]|uniref:Phage portal protein n=1 Tax=Halalkalibacter krulwichiae TaxID=199441 RepID=A0A1X9MFB9_9BACI|nr:phage portal protein [Halalkalibacter krulwichiae]ARK32138.1 Phage portal protein [Halalkalibacter krulwichiae]